MIVRIYKYTIIYLLVVLYVFVLILMISLLFFDFLCEMFSRIDVLLYRV